MHTYVLLKDGRRMVRFSYEPEQEQMAVFPVGELEGYDPEWLTLETVPYNAVARVDTDRSVAYA